MEEKYWELRETVSRALENYLREPNAYFKLKYDIAWQKYAEFCVDTLEKLMEENSDVLKRLKDA